MFRTIKQRQLLQPSTKSALNESSECFLRLNFVKTTMKNNYNQYFIQKLICIKKKKLKCFYSVFYMNLSNIHIRYQEIFEKLCFKRNIYRVKF